MAAPLHHRIAAAVGLPFMVAASLACASCGKRAPTSDASAQDPPAAPARDVLEIFALGRVKGTVAPCGCTTEPLGGVQYAFGFLEDRAETGHRLVLEPGSLLFPDPEGPDAPPDEAAWEQARKRAELLHFRFSQLGDGLVSGLGPLDFAAPKSAGLMQKLDLPRVLANVKQAGIAPPYRVVEVKAGERIIKVGVTAVTDPALKGAIEVGPLTKLEPAIRKQLEKMSRDGVDLTVAMIQAPRATVETLARNVEGLDFALAGLVEGTERQRVGAPPARIGDTWVLEPGEQLQTTTHVRLSLAPGASIGDTASWQVIPPRSEQAAELERLEARLEKFAADPSADPAYLQRLRDERDALRKRLDGEAKIDAPVAITIEQVKITCHQPVDGRAKNALEQYEGWVARENKKRFADVSAPEPPPGKPGYAGVEECDACHDEAVSFWNKTKHAQAYATLERDNKQFDLSCVGCHVTGFREPGGSEVVKNEGLTNVQCEVCHGPGSLHAEDPDKNGTAQHIRREAPADVCGACHTPEHSDTFEYEAYLRDILGPGHGAEARKALGQGPTGEQLRQAGLAKAGGSCKKM